MLVVDAYLFMWIMTSEMVAPPTFAALVMLGSQD